MNTKPTSHQKMRAKLEQAKAIIQTFLDNQECRDAMLRVSTTGLNNLEQIIDEIQIQKSPDFQSLLESVNDVVWTATIEGKMLYINHAVERVYGHPIADFFANPNLWHEIVHPDDRAEVKKGSQQLQQLGQLEQSYRIVLPDGEIRWLRDHKSVIYDINGKLNQIGGIATDITEQMQIKEALRESEEFHRLILENISDALFVTDEQGTFVYVCPNAHVIFGYQTEEVQAFDNITKLLGDLPINLDEATEQLTNIEHEITDKFGQKHFLLINIKRVSIKEGTWLYTCRDISERRQILDALRISEEKYRRIFETAPLSILVTDKAGKIIDINDYHIAHFGAGKSTKTDYIGKNLLTHPTLVAVGLSGDYQKRLEGKPVEKKTVYFPATTSGIDCYVNVMSKPLRKEDDIIGAVIIHDDVTTLVQKEAKIHHLATIVEQAIEGIASTNFEGTIQFANQAWANIHGYATGEELIGKHLSIFHTEAQLQNEVLPFNEKVKRHQCHRGEVGHQRKDGTTFLGYMNVTFFKNERDIPIGFIGFLTDITQQKQAETAIRQSEAKFRSLAENSPNYISIVDREGIIQFVNRTISKLSPQEIVGNSLYDYLHSSQEKEILKHALNDVFETGKVTSLEYLGGISYSWYESRIRLIKQNDQTKTAIIHTFDISERKRAEQALQESEERYKRLVKVTNEGIIFHDKGITVDVNPSFLQMFGYEFDELIGKDAIDMFVLPKYQALVRKNVAIGFNQPYEVMGSQKDGTCFPVELQGKEYEYNGKILRVTSVVDITERKRAEHELNQHIYQLESLAALGKASNETQEINHMMENALRVTLSVFHCDRAWLQHPCDPDAPNWRVPMEVTTPEYPGAKILNTDIPMDPTISEMMRVSLSVKEPVAFGAMYEYKIAPMVAKQFSVQSRVSMAIYPKLGKPWQFGIHQCSYARIWTDEELQLFNLFGQHIGDSLDVFLSIEAFREGELKWQHALTASQDGLWDWNVVTNEVYFSPSWKKMLGYADDEITADLSDWDKRIHPDDKESVYLNVNKHLAYDTEYYRSEHRLLCKDGTYKWILDRGKVIELTTEGKPLRFIGTHSDISERKQMEMELIKERASLAKKIDERTAELSQANAELARASRLKDEFLANMSHELRTPLNAILTMSELLTDGIYGEINEKQLKAIGHIENGGTHLLSLITDILDLSKIEAGKMKLEPENIVIEGVCRACVQMVKQIAMKKQVRVVFASDDNVETLFADQRAVKQILVNLLNNAVKFTPNKGEVTLELQGDKINQVANINVIDTGIGIPEHELDNLFKPFMQIDSSLSRHHEGTGLGLALVYRLAKLHGGSVSVTSEIGEGSTFTVSLPWREYGKSTANSDDDYVSTVKNDIKVHNKGAVVLVAEDNETNIVTVKDGLTAYGYKVIITRDGAEALDRAHETKPAIILMDIQMPGMNGLEATRQIRADEQLAQTPIIALTALAMPGDKQRCLNAGANVYLSKPVNIKQLVGEIEKLLICVC